MAGVINNVGAGAIAAAGAATAGITAGVVAEAATEVAEATDGVASADLGHPFAVFPMRQRPSLWQRWATPTPKDLAYDAAVAAHLRNPQAGMLDMGGFILVFSGLAASIAVVVSLIPLTGIIRRAIADVRSRREQGRLEIFTRVDVETPQIKANPTVVDLVDKAVILNILASATASDEHRKQAIAAAQQFRITEAIPLLMYLATQPQFTDDAIVALGELHATEAVPMLRENVGTYGSANFVYKKRAKLAVEALAKLGTDGRLALTNFLTIPEGFVEARALAMMMLADTATSNPELNRILPTIVKYAKTDMGKIREDVAFQKSVLKNVMITVTDSVEDHVDLVTAAVDLLGAMGEHGVLEGLMKDNQASHEAKLRAAMILGRTQTALPASTEIGVPQTSALADAPQRAPAKTRAMVLDELLQAALTMETAALRADALHGTLEIFILNGDWAHFTIAVKEGFAALREIADPTLAGGYGRRFTMDIVQQLPRVPDVMPSLTIRDQLNALIQKELEAASDEFLRSCLMTIKVRLEGWARVAQD